jgi:hypothetical protein
VIGAFDLGVSFLTVSSAALREQGRLSDLARVLFAQAWAEMEVGDWRGAMREAEESVRFAEETGGTLWIAAATIVKAKLAGMMGNVEQSEALAAQAEGLVLSIGASFLLAMLQIARGTAALGSGRIGRPTSICGAYLWLPIPLLILVFNSSASRISWRRPLIPAMCRPLAV